MTRYEFHRQLIRVYRRSYRRNRIILQVYQRLGLQSAMLESHHPMSEAQHELLQRLSSAAAQRASRCLIRLQRLGQSTQILSLSWGDQCLCFITVYGGVSLTLSWIDWLESQDVQELSLFFLKKKGQDARRPPDLINVNMFAIRCYR